MADKSSDSFRKKPKQGRSKELVDAIYTATVRILPQIGSAKITTRKIAEVAGVSIGSLYQYFPNKDSVLAAVMDAMSELINSTLLSRFERLSIMELDEAIQYTVDTTLELLIGDTTITREVYRYVSELGRMPAMFAFRREGVDQLTRELHRRYPHIPRRECERICFLTTNSLIGVVLTRLYDETQTWTREELAVEIGRMIRLYVKDSVASR